MTNFIEAPSFSGGRSIGMKKQPDMELPPLCNKPRFATRLGRTRDSMIYFGFFQDFVFVNGRYITSL